MSDNGRESGARPFDVQRAIRTLPATFDANAVLLLLLLVSHMQPKPQPEKNLPAWATFLPLARLALEARLSVRTVQRTMDALDEAHRLVRRCRPNRARGSMVYVLDVTRILELGTSGNAEMKAALEAERSARPKTRKARRDKAFSRSVFGHRDQTVFGHPDQTVFGHPDHPTATELQPLEYSPCSIGASHSAQHPLRDDEGQRPGVHPSLKSKGKRTPKQWPCASTGLKVPVAVSRATWQAVLGHVTATNRTKARQRKALLSWLADAHDAGRRGHDPDGVLADAVALGLARPDMDRFDGWRDTVDSAPAEEMAGAILYRHRVFAEHRRGTMQAVRDLIVAGAPPRLVSDGADAVAQHAAQGHAAASADPVGCLAATVRDVQKRAAASPDG
jgi:hypothetical protein